MNLTKRSLSTIKNKLPSKADVVVVGGGSIGTSILYHLKKQNVNAILLERHQLTAGTTWHSAGMLWRLRPSYVDIELHTYTRKMCKQLADETEIESWTENGGLFISTNKERHDEYSRLHETGRYYGIESHMLHPSEIKDIHPLINTEDVYGGLFSPSDGTIDPTGIVNAYAKGARQLAKEKSCIFENVGVASLETKSIYSTNGGGNVVVKSLITDCDQRIETPLVINACGAWANELAGMVGVKLPLHAMKHAFVVTEKIPGVHPGLPNVRDHDLSIYLKTQGDALAIGGYEQNPEFWTDVKKDFKFGLFELDWDTFNQNLEGHMRRCPAIETTGIKSTVCGPESFTPDHKPLVGPQPGTTGFFNACGFNSMGMMLGGGMGREVANWITKGSPSLDLFSYDCSRFHPDSLQDSKWVKDRTHESYAKTYAIVFPHDESLAGRKSRMSPLHDELVSRGCIHQARHGFERPGWFLRDNSDDAAATTMGVAPQQYDYYGAYSEENSAWRLGGEREDENCNIKNIPKNDSDFYLENIEQELTFDWPLNQKLISEECRAAREGVAIFDQSYFGKFFLSGQDAKKAAQWLCGADILKQKPGSVSYTPLCNEQGGCEADLTITCLPDETGYYFAAGGNTMTKDFQWIRRVLDQKKFNCTFVDKSNQLTMISIQGPHSRNLLNQIISSNHTLSDDELPFSMCQNIEIGGFPAMCLRLTFVGELGYELHVQNEFALQIYRILREAGSHYEHTFSVPVRDAGYRAIDSLSAEKNYRHWHADLSNSDTPLEANIGFTVLSKLKANGNNYDFLGRQALEIQRKNGLKRKLVCLVLEDDSIPLHGGETIWRDGACLGIVRSAAFGYTIGKSIAYGYVESPKDVHKITNKWLEQGEWHIGDKGTKMHNAIFHKSAPFDPKNHRVKGDYGADENHQSILLGLNQNCKVNL